MIEIVVLGLSLGLIYIYISTANNLKLNDNVYDAKNRQIANIKTPESETDVVTVRYVDSSMAALSEQINNVNDSMNVTYKGLKRACNDESSAAKKRIITLEKAQLNINDIRAKTNEDITKAITSLDIPFYATIKDGISIGPGTNAIPLVFDYSTGGTCAELGSGHIFIKTINPIKIEILIKILDNADGNIKRIHLKDTFGHVDQALDLLSIGNYFYYSYNYEIKPKDTALSFIISSKLKGIFYPYIKISSQYTSNDFCFKPILSDLLKETEKITTKINDIVKTQKDINDSLVTKTVFNEELGNVVTKTSFSDSLSNQKRQNETFVSKGDFQNLEKQAKEMKDTMVSKTIFGELKMKINDEMVTKTFFNGELGNVVTKTSFSDSLATQNRQNKTFVSKDDFQKLEKQASEMISKPIFEELNKKVNDEMVTKTVLKTELEEKLKSKISNDDINGLREELLETMKRQVEKDIKEYADKMKTNAEEIKPSN